MGDADLGRLRALNARTAADYDAVPYDPSAAQYADRGLIYRPASILFGFTAAPQDILDIGCGGGGLLEAFAARAKGRLVGVDISAASCERARERFATAGREVTIHCADVLDLEPAGLGQFDLILCVGSAYIVPEPVREQMLRLIGECLRPGGVAIISLYGGHIAYISGEIRRILADTVDPNLEPAQRLADGHAILDQVLAAGLEGGASQAVLDHLKHYRGRKSSTAFHELFGPALDVVRCADVNRTLSAYGVGMLGDLPCDPTMLFQGPHARAVAADVQQFVKSRYHFALFGNWGGAPRDITFDNAHLAWSTKVRRAPEDIHAFAEPGGGASVTTKAASTSAFLAALAVGPLLWREAVDRARALTREPFDEAALQADVLYLWRMGVIEATPLDEA